MPGSSQLDVQFLQGWAPEVNFLDCGRTLMAGQTVCVPYNCFEGVLVIDEWSPIQSGSAHQRKYYAPYVGNVLVGAVDDPEGETLVMSNLLQLSPQLLAEARAAALQLEARAYEINELYRLTPPAH